MSMFKLRHPPIRSPLAVALLLALAVPAISHAEPEAQTLDTVRVQGNAAPKHATDARSATRTDTPLRDVPAAISAVTAIELEERNVRSLNQALETVPGVSLTMGEGRRDQVNIRGFSAMFDQYLDGFRDDTPYYRDLADIERVEVLRGPASVLYGRGSGGGIINRITKQPVFGGDIGRTTLSLGAYDALRGTLDVGHGSDAFAWRFNAAAEQAESFRKHVELERQLAAPALAWKLGEGSLLLQVEALRDRRTPDRGIPSLAGRPAPVDSSTTYGDPLRDYLNNDAADARLTWHSPLGEHWELRAALVDHQARGDFYNTFVSSVNATTLQVARAQYNSTSETDDRFARLETLGNLDGTWLDHALLIGLEAGWQDRSSKRWTGSAGTVSLFNPDLSVGSTPSSVLGNSSAFNGDSVGLYVQDQMSLGESWKAVVGGRWDRYGQVADNRLTQARLDRTDTTFSPRAGLVWQPNTSHSLYAAWSRSFQTSGDGYSLATTSADLSPEHSTLKEVGWKGDWNEGALSASAALFEQTRDGLRTIDPADPTRLIQVGMQRSRGLELEVGGRIGERLDLRLGYTRLQAQIVKSNDRQSGVSLQGNRPSNVPEQLASLWATWTLGHGFDLGVGAFASGSRFSANDNLVRLPGYVRTDAMLRWRHGEHELALNVRNLGDIAWIESAHSTNQIMPGTPRAATLSWRYNFR